MKTEVIDFKSFVNGSYKRPTALQTVAKRIDVVVKHVERHKVVYRVGAAVIVLFLVCDVTAFADSALDAKANALYKGKLLGIGKWAIIIKGGWTTIHKTIQEDFDGAKKSFFQYLLVYMFLLAFPWAMNEMDGVFA